MTEIFGGNNKFEAHPRTSSGAFMVSYLYFYFYCFVFGPIRRVHAQRKFNWSRCSGTFAHSQSIYMCNRKELNIPRFRFSLPKACKALVSLNRNLSNFCFTASDFELGFRASARGARPVSFSKYSHQTNYKKI